MKCDNSVRLYLMIKLMSKKDNKLMRFIMTDSGLVYGYNETRERRDLVT